jgi:hypothetical protein
VSLESQLETENERTQRWKGGHDHASFVMHLQAIIERDWRSAWRRSI